MSVLWCGGEDIDFPNGATPAVSTSSSFRRAGYARCALGSGSVGAVYKSVTFTPITNGWLSARVCQAGATYSPSFRFIGFGKSGTDSGLFIASSSTSASKLALIKRNAGTNTQLATEAGNSFTATLHRFDMQVVNYGASATVNVYCDGVLVITFTGDVTVSGVSDLDQAVLITNAGTSGVFFSEVIVADEDLRAWPGLVTLALTGDGTTSQWTGTYSNINATGINDANPIYTNTVGQDEQFNVTDLPSGTFLIKAVKIAARAAAAAGSTATQIALGYNDGGSVAVGSAQTQTTAYATYEQLDATNPVTGAAFTQAEMNALQLNVRSS